MDIRHHTTVWNAFEDQNPWEAEQTLHVVASGEVAQPAEDGDVEDDWGDFESVNASSNTAIPFQATALQEQNPWGDLSGFEQSSVGDNRNRAFSVNINVPSGSPHREILEDAFTKDVEALRSDDGKPLNQQHQSIRHRNDNVLFDIDNETDGDDFGEFETGDGTDSTREVPQFSGTNHVPPATNVLIDLEMDSVEESKSVGWMREDRRSVTTNRTPLDVLEGLTKPSDSEIFEDSSTTYHSQYEDLPFQESFSDQPWDNFEDSMPESGTASYNGSNVPVDRSHNAARRQDTERARLSNSVIGGIDPWDNSEVIPGIGPDENASDAWDDFDNSFPDAEDRDTAQPPSTHGDGRIKTSARSANEESLQTPEKPVESPVDLHPMIKSGSNKSTSSPAPSNIPPPTLLLSLFPPLLAHARSHILKILPQDSKSPQARSEILVRQNTKLFLASYLGLGIVLAHIVAGRKLRWKRDTILSQSMRIGPASSNRTSGMKLTGLEKGETNKEDREVTESVKLWKNQLGTFRTIVSAAGLTQSIPDVTEVLPVRIAQPNEGAISSTKGCALCGLKRNERVPKVDIDIQDSFGEWWVDHWGHTLCMNFWNTQKDNLQSRK